MTSNTEPISKPNHRTQTLHIVAILTIRTAEWSTFEEFERHAARVMNKHQGRITQTIVTDPAVDAETYQEIHVIQFPSQAAFSAYRNDTDLAEKAHLRERAVVSTEVYVGSKGPDYHE